MAVDTSRVRASVAISSRNQPDKLRRCLDSLLRSLPSDCEIVCIDQSDSPPAANVIPSAANLHYIPSTLRGLNVGRNAAAVRARGEILLFTDDDCIIPPGWVESWIELFERWPGVDIAFGAVRAAEPDRRNGFTVDFLPSQFHPSRRMTLLRRWPDAFGNENNMAIRRRAWARVGGFDAIIGAGSSFGGWEGFDIAYRILRTGGELVHSRGPALIHDGFHTPDQMRHKTMLYFAGAGAVYLKHVRCGDRLSSEIALANTWRMVREPIQNLLTGRRPLHLRRLLAYMTGMASSLRLDVDRSQRLFRPRRRPGSREVETSSPSQTRPPRRPGQPHPDTPARAHVRRAKTSYYPRRGAGDKHPSGPLTSHPARTDAPPEAGYPQSHTPAADTTLVTVRGPGSPIIDGSLTPPAPI
jgi:GT2 family glycosyltransferase